ncbi:MAG: hypothetical protein ACYTG4_00100, partial [Planctomycetota bacterium]
VKIVCNGTFNIRGTGVIDASGGQGARGYYYSGGGGGGSGGGVWIVAGDEFTLNGTIDVAGGKGGLKVYRNGYSSNNQARGGNGSAGRVRIEAPNLSTTTTNLMAGIHRNTITSGDLNGGTGALGSFPSTSTTINVDALRDSNGFLNYSTANVPAGVTITFTGANPAKLRFTGDVSISGVLKASGGTGGNGRYSSSSFAVNTGGSAGAGGGKGGVPNSKSTSNHLDAEDGNGTGKGKGGKKSTRLSGSTTYGYYPGGGGGASNLYNSEGKDGLQSAYLRVWYGVGLGGDAGSGYTDPEGLSMAALTGGSGGGPGANAIYKYSYSWGSGGSYYGGGAGGGGGGAIAIETEGDFTLNSTGRFDLYGGNGGYGYSSSGGGGGGGGSGGNFLVRADTISLSSGATVNTSGGIGQKAWNYPYYDPSNTGGNGGRPRGWLRTSTPRVSTNRAT